MAQISRYSSASLAFLIVWVCLPHADAQSPPQLRPAPEKEFNNGSNSDGRVFVELTQGENGRHETLVIRSGKGIYRAPDERLPVYNDDDSSYDHDFYLSPDRKWLFVTRKLFHTTDIGYLYHVEGEHVVKVRPQGLRFDEAALVFFSRRLHFSYNPIGDGTRIIYFNQWTASGKRLTFEFHSSRHYESKHYQIIKGFYDLQSRRFGLISHPSNNE